MASKKLQPTFKTLLRTGSLEETTNSASLAEAERKVKFLEKENEMLKEEIVEIKAMYVQLTKESSHENYDERRVNFLKAQLIQLERQILLLNEALGGRMAVVLEAENALQVIIERCRHYEQQGDRIGETLVSKEDLKLIVHTAESAKMKLYKNIENTTMQRLHKPLKFLDKFVKRRHMEEPTLLDVCSGEMDHINLKQVAKLESQLSQIYSQLLRVNQCLAVQVFPESFNTSEKNCQVGPQVPEANFIKLFGESSKACNLLSEVLPDLLELSVLVPAAPWPMLKKRVVKELSVDNVMARLPAVSKSKAGQVRETVESLLKVISLLQLKAKTQENTYREELRYHKTVYQLQLEYIDNLFKSLKSGYNEFEKDASNLICSPLSEVLRIYETLNVTASEEALRQFLKVFKKYQPQIATAVAKLEVKESDPEGFSSFGEEFFEKLYTLEIECQQMRDENIKKLQEVKDQQEDYWVEIKKMFHIDTQNPEDNQHEPQNDSHTARSSPMENSKVQQSDQGDISNFSDLSSRNGKPEQMSRNLSSKTEKSVPVSGHFSSRSEKSEQMSHETDTYKSNVVLPLIEQQVQTKSRSSLLSRRPRSSSANQNGRAEKKWDSEETLKGTQTESEEIFKASLRADYDGRKDFDFSMDSNKEDSSNCTCGAEQSAEETQGNSPVKKDSVLVQREKPPSGRRDSPLHKSNISSGSTNNKPTRGVPKTKLVLKPRMKKDSSGPASDSESDVWTSKTKSEHKSKSDERQSRDAHRENTKDAVFPYKSGEIRSGSVPRNSGKIIKHSTSSSPWK